MPRVKEEYQKYQKPADKQADIQQQAPQTANKKAAGGVLVEGMDNCLRRKAVPPKGAQLVRLGVAWAAGEYPADCHTPV